MKLLTAAASNAKTAKNMQFDAYISYILHLAPADLSGYNVCPRASVGCKAACLNSAGRGAFNSVQIARIKKTKFFMEQRREFLELLYKDLVAVQRKAAKLGKIGVVRLNGTSDINWRAIRFSNGLNAFEAFPMLQFYDYTAVLRHLQLQTEKPYSNYYLIFSAKESNSDDIRAALALNFNVAMVFDAIPRVYKGFNVVNGDAHDLRFLEPARGLIIGLKAKGKAKRDTSGFVRYISNLNNKTA